MRGKKAAKKARRKERDAAQKAVEDPPAITAPATATATNGTHAPQASPLAVAASEGAASVGAAEQMAGPDSTTAADRSPKARAVVAAAASEDVSPRVTGDAQRVGAAAAESIVQRRNGRHEALPDETTLVADSAARTAGTAQPAATDSSADR